MQESVASSFLNAAAVIDHTFFWNHSLYPAMKLAPKYAGVAVASAVFVVVAIILVVVIEKKPQKSESFSSAGRTEGIIEIVDQTVAPTNSHEPTSSPSTIASHWPSLRHSMPPSIWPSDNPTQSPSLNPSMIQSEIPTLDNSTDSPTFSLTEWNETSFPTFDSSNDTLPPTIFLSNDTLYPTSDASFVSTSDASFASTETNETDWPTQFPTLFPTRIMSDTSAIPTETPSIEGPGGRFGDITQEPTKEDHADLELLTRFYAIGDVPYSTVEAEELLVQMQNIPLDAEFVIHVGDIRIARDGRACDIEEFYEVARILNQSHVPVFLVLGDNEYNDCPNFDEGFSYWNTVFGNFDEQWDHSFDLMRQENRTDNFAFVHKRTLFVGLNIVGGTVHDEEEWSDRLVSQFEWVQHLVSTLVTVNVDQSEADAVVIFGHANPVNDHKEFFDPLTNYLQNDLNGSIPFFYLNGDGHKFIYKESFKDVDNLLRIQVEGGTRDNPLQLSVNSAIARSTRNLSAVFTYDRMEDLILI